MERNKDKRDGGLVELYSIFKGEVASVQNYGVFVRIPYSKKQGLVHKSQMTSAKLDSPEEMVSLGETVWCKVISVDADGGKVGLSMKVVNQTTGKDQDPNHVQTSLDEQRRKTGHKRGNEKIELGAVFDTTCSKCGGKGHLAGDCFHVPGGKSYDLLPEVDYLMTQPAMTEGSGTTSKHKKEGKRKKHRHRHGSSSDSDTERHKKKQKKLKRKSSHRRESESDESDVPKRKQKKLKRKSSHSETESDESDVPKHKKKKEKKKKKHKHSS